MRHGGKEACGKFRCTAQGPGHEWAARSQGPQRKSRLGNQGLTKGRVVLDQHGRSTAGGSGWAVCAPPLLPAV